MRKGKLAAILLAILAALIVLYLVFRISGQSVKPEEESVIETESAEPEESASAEDDTVIIENEGEIEIIIPEDMESEGF